MTSLPIGGDKNRVRFGNGKSSLPMSGQKITLGKANPQFGTGPRLQVPPQAAPPAPTPAEPSAVAGEHLYTVEAYILGADGRQYTATFQTVLPVQGELQGVFFYEAQP